MACKQLREEALDVFYGTNTFSFGHRNWISFFASRITRARALLLRQMEFYSDVEWSIDTGSIWTWLSFYSGLDLWQSGVLSKFANVRKIHIEICESEQDEIFWDWEVLKSEEEPLMEERLQREFGSLSQLKRIESVTVRPRFRMVYHFLDDDNVSNYEMRDVLMRDIGDRFASKLVGGCVE